MKFIFNTLFLSLIISFASLNVSAQYTVGDQDFKDLVQFQLDVLKSFDSYQSSIYENGDNQDIIIIDFQEINVNLKSINVLDANAEVVFTEDVRDLPVNALYELDLSAYSKGNYTIQMESYGDSFYMDLVLN